MADPQTGFDPNSPFGQAVKQYGMDRPEVSADTYDEWREHYFNKRIAPRLHPNERGPKREDFLRRTQRASMPTSEYLQNLANVTISEASRIAAKSGEMFPRVTKWLQKGMPPENIAPEGSKEFQKDVAARRQALAYHGQKYGGTAEFAGGVLGYTAGMRLAGKVAGPVMGAASEIPVIGPVAGAAGKVLSYGAPTTMGIVKRSLAFGAFQFTQADPGQRTSEFVKGTEWGVVGELAGASLGGLWKYFKGRKDLPTPKEVDDFIKTMARGEGPTTQAETDIDAALAEDVHQTAKKPGYLDKVQTVLDEKAARPIAVFVDQQGHAFESPLAKSPEKAYAQLKEAIGQGEKGARYLARIVHDEFDQPFVNDLLAKLKQEYEPWSTTPTQIASDARQAGVNAGGGTARVDNKVLKSRYAPSAPSREDARRFIKAAINYPGYESTNVVKDRWNTKIDELMRQFDTVWNARANHLARTEAANKLEEMGLSDIIPTPEVRARWRTSEGMNLPKIFNEKGWYETLDNWRGRTEEGEETTLDLRTKEHLTSSMKILWDPSVPVNSPMFQSALRSLTQFELNDFLPGRISREEIGSLITPSRAGTETEAKALARIEQARKEPTTAAVESYYQRVGRLAETLAKQKDPDLTHYYEQYGHQTVDAAMNMAGLMWERSKGDLLQVKWDEALLKRGIEEGILPSIDSAVEPSDIESLRRASLESNVLRLAEQFNVDPRNVDRELLEEVGEAEVQRAKEVADAAKKRGVSVYDASMMEEARRLGILGDDEAAFSPREIPPSERPSRLPGEPAGVPDRTVRFQGGAVGKFMYNVRRAASGQPSRIYLMFNDAIHKKFAWAGVHESGASIVNELEKHNLVHVMADLQTIADTNGIDLRNTLVTVVHKPDIGFKKGYSAGNVWHEDLHGMLSQLGLTKAIERGTSLRGSEGTINDVLKDAYQALPASMQDTWDAFAKAVGKRYGELYSKLQTGEEGFVQAATAIRHDDIGTIAHFAAVDTDVQHVFDAVQSIAGELRKAAGEMAPGASKNVIMDRLGFLEGISTLDRYNAVREAAEQMFADAGGEPVSIMLRGDRMRYDNYSKLFQTAEESLEGRAYAPNYTSWAEAAGARHAMYPTQMPPGRTAPPMPETGLEDGWRFSPSLIWEKLAPTFSWINWVDSKLNAKFGVKGRYFPLADRAKAVDEAYRAGGAWLNENQESALRFLEGGKKKLETYGFMMTRQLREWPGLAQKMQLTNEDLARLKMAREWLQKFEADTGVRVMDYLQNIQPRLASHGYDISRVFPNPAKGSSMSTFHKLIVSGELNPKDLHLGRLTNVFLRQGMENKFTGEALSGLQKLIDTKHEGKYILGELRNPLQRYIHYMRGIPDNGGKMINDTVRFMQEGINNRIKDINKRLPEGYKMKEIAWTGDALRKGMLLSYISGIGLRPAIAIRDWTQGFSLSLPIIGPSSFFRGFASAMTKERQALMQEAGVFLKGKNVAEVFGDIYQEMTPGKGGLMNQVIDKASWLLAPSRWGHNLARATVFSGVYDDALSQVGALRKLERMSPDAAKKFLDKTGLWFADEARQKQLLSLARDKYVPPKEVAKQIGLEMLDLTLWPYRRGTQPGFLKTGIGRVFGQYGLWPMSFLDYIRRLGSKVQENPKKALPALGAFLAINYELVVQARKHLGVDVSKWFMFSPSGFAGSPHLEFVKDLMISPEETNEGRLARKRVMEYPLQFAPTYNEIRALEETWDKPWIDEQGHITQDGLKAMGFRMFKPGEPTFEQVLNGDITPTKWLEYESGMKTSEYSKFGKAVKKAAEKVTQ